MPAHLALAALYAFVLIASAFLHHDFQCHLKSRTHCSSCVFSQTAAGVEAQAPVPELPGPDVQSLVLVTLPLVSPDPLFFGTDSSPPTT